jgi:hypothetical protein
MAPPAQCIIFLNGTAGAVQIFLTMAPLGQ